jgi:hypothetical protein
MLNDDQLIRLVPFFNRLSRRQRLIMYLASVGYSVPDLVSMTVQVLRSIELPEKIEPYREEVLEELPSAADDAPCFVFSPSGKVLRPTDFNRTIRHAAVKTFDREFSRTQLIEYIQSGTISH